MSTSTTRTLSAATLALALGSALSMTALPMSAHAADSMEKCFGVAQAGKNDCAAGAGTTCAGTSTKNFQANSWKSVPAGTCVTLESQTSPTGKGQLAAFTPKA
ncbi:DUF2282 domain-containing protein [Pseudomonas gingeri]|uniref:BufA1 family periplasmic bufferin-type metallophore n=1 Tax=Pseudomonas gingeri TaxID=117681 RepID=UPI0015A4BF29|nr:DUF2282 domain-containing protein [Pseudomonas gingeri]NWA23755.1 DUF2282 domain-containing protein [Pseudomonas gingeri]